MNNITVVLRNPQTKALDAIERLQRWWEESEALEPESRMIEIPVVYGGTGGPDLGVVADHCGLTEKQVVELHSSVDYVVWFLGFQPGFPYLGGLSPAAYAAPGRATPERSRGNGGDWRRTNRNLSAHLTGRLAAYRIHLHAAI